MKVFCATDIGCVRTLNEDSYYMPADGERFMAVADGMGGHLAGEVASRAAIRTLTSVLTDDASYGEDRLRFAFGRANREVYVESERDPSKRGMGTTLTALWFSDDSVIVGHVGDSRAYRLRDGRLMQATTDHTYVEELVKNGVITPEMALKHPQRNVITRSIGPWPRVEADIERYDLKKGGVWLLCTDGLTRYVTADELLIALSSPNAWNEKVGALINTALQRGGADSETVVLAVEESDGDE